MKTFFAPLILSFIGTNASAEDLSHSMAAIPTQVDVECVEGHLRDLFDTSSNSQSDPAYVQIIENRNDGHLQIFNLFARNERQPRQINAWVFTQDGTIIVRTWINTPILGDDLPDNFESVDNYSRMNQFSEFELTDTISRPEELPYSGRPFHDSVTGAVTNCLIQRLIM